MINPEIIASVAAFFGTIGFLPQAIKVIKTRDTQAISLWTYILFVASIASWLLYGIAVQSFAIITGNVITITLASIILFYKFTEK